MQGLEQTWIRGRHLSAVPTMTWYKVGTVSLTAGTTYTLTMEAAGNTFVSQRLAGVMWEVIPEPTAFALGALGLLALGVRRRIASR